MKLARRLVTTSILTILLSGCVGINATADNFCNLAEPITWSSEDTRETILEIAEHNKVYDEICGG